MDMSGEQRINAPQEVVWAALNDPEILRKCIPGCQELEKHSDTQMTATAVIKVGPVSAKFKGSVTLSDLDPPNGYRITGEGEGGVAGFAKGAAAVKLEQDGDATVLQYTVSAQIGGKLSQLGGRLIDATARKMSDAFFKKFAEEIYAGRNGEKAAVASGSAAAPVATGPTHQAGAERRSPPASSTTYSVPTMIESRGSWVNQGLLLFIAIAMAWIVFAGTGKSVVLNAPTAFSSDLSSVIQLIVVLMIGYLLGTHQSHAKDNFMLRQLMLSLLSERRDSNK